MPFYLFLLIFDRFFPLIRLTNRTKRNIINSIIGKAVFACNDGEDGKGRQMNSLCVYNLSGNGSNGRTAYRSLYYRFMYAIRFSYRYFLLHSKTLRSGAARR